MNRKLIVLPLLASLLAGCGPYKPSFPAAVDDSNSSVMTVRIEPDLPATFKLQARYKSTARHCEYTPRWLLLVPVLNDAIPSEFSTYAEARKVGPGTYEARAPRPIAGHCGWRLFDLSPVVKVEGSKGLMRDDLGYVRIDGKNVLMSGAAGSASARTEYPALGSTERRFVCQKRSYTDESRSSQPTAEGVTVARAYFSCADERMAFDEQRDATLTLRMKP